MNKKTIYLIAVFCIVIAGTIGIAEAWFYILEKAEMRFWPLDLSELWHDEVLALDVVEPKTNNLLERLDNNSVNHYNWLYTDRAHRTGEDIGVRRFWSNGLIQASIFTLENSMLKINEDIYPNAWTITEEIFSRFSASQQLPVYP